MEVVNRPTVIHLNVGVSLVDAAATKAFLEQRLGEQIASVVTIGAGAWSQAYRFEREGRSWVIRWSDLAENFARDVFAICFAGDELPIPPITDSGHGQLGYFAIAPFVEGSDFEMLPAERLSHLLPSLFGMFRALRRVDLDRLGTSGYGIWDGNGNGLSSSWQAFLLDDKDDSPGSLIRGWKAELAASPYGMGGYRELRARLEPLVAGCPSERRLVHSDLINHNVLAAGDRITAVLDWGSSLYGDPLWDVAWLAFYEPWYPAFSEINLVARLLDDFIVDPMTNHERIDDRLLCYQLAIGLDSIAYTASRRDWAHARETTERAFSLLR